MTFVAVFIVVEAAILMGLLFFVFWPSPKPEPQQRLYTWQDVADSFDRTAETFRTMGGGFWR